MSDMSSRPSERPRGSSSKALYLAGPSVSLLSGAILFVHQHSPFDGVDAGLLLWGVFPYSVYAAANEGLEENTGESMFHVHLHDRMIPWFLTALLALELHAKHRLAFGAHQSSTEGLSLLFVPLAQLAAIFTMTAILLAANHLSRKSPNDHR